MQKLREQLDALKSEGRPVRGSLISDSLGLDDDYDAQSKLRKRKKEKIIKTFFIQENQIKSYPTINISYRKLNRKLPVCRQT